MVAVPLTATYATAGTFSWTCPAGVTSVTVACTGAGGGAGAAATASGSNGGGGGGGEGANEPSVAVTPGLSYSLTVGAAGAGGTAGTKGSAGGDTSFTGDTQTVYAHGGQGGLAAGAAANGQPGTGGTGSTNTVSADGGAGDSGTAATNGGGGGAAAGTSVLAGFPGNPGSGSTAGAASGGTWPGGAGGAGAVTGAAGSAGSAPGGGGGGGLSTGAAHAGGAGAAGQVVITWTMTDPVTLSANTAGGVWQFQAPLGATAVTAQAWGGGAGGFNTGAAGGTGVAGFSAFTSTYGSPRSAAAATVDSYIGQPVAITAQVIYYDEEEYPNSTTDSQNAAQVAALGCKITAVFKCSRRAVVAGGSTLTAQQSAFAAGLAYLQSIPGINLGQVVIGNEPNGFGTSGPFGNGSSKDWKFGTPYTLSGTTAQQQAETAANFLAYFAAFVPTAVAAGLQVAYKPVVFSTTMGISMFPGAGSAHGGVDLILADWYASDFTKNSEDLFGSSNLEGVADTAGIPLGIGEWGASASGTLPNGWKNSDWTGTWMPHFLGGFQNRLTAGKPVADIVYFGADSLSGANAVTGKSDYKAAGIASVYTALNQAQPSGGAGGGGGEFAQESALAITGLSSYTLVVGAGGADRASGASSTVAGDSVTVTAHGGSVATAVGTGGTGGTGSSNGTHHNGGQGGAGGITNGGGGGGGGSGGTAAAGNAGAAGGSNFGGAGGTAVTNGGPGGKGGGPALNGAPPLSGPGGGGGARGASGFTSGPGADGQLILSSFVTHPACVGSFALAPLALAGASVAPAASYGLAPLALAGTATVSNFSQTQLGALATGTGSAAATCSATAALSTLFAVVGTTGNTAITAPQGWVQDVTVTEGGGANGIVTIWRYSAQPGGITSVTFSGGGGDTIRAFLLEVATPAGWTAALDTSNTATGTTGATSLPVSTAGANAGGDMAIAAFVDRFSGSTSGSWTTPASWALLRSESSSANWYAGYARYGLAATTQSVTGTVSTSTGETGWGAALATYTIVPLTTSSGSFALAPLALAGTGNAVLGPGQIATSGGIALAPLAFQSPSLAATFPETELPRKVEILLNGTWTDITSYVLGDISVSARGRADEASTAQPAQCAFTLSNLDGSFSPKNPAGQFYPYLTRNTQIRVSVVNAVAPSGAWYNGYRFWGEVPGWPPTWDITGINVKVPITAAGVLQRLQQSKTLGSPVSRYYAQDSGGLVPGGYWPCEDGPAATSFASGLSGGSPMTWSGSPGLAADSSVPGSSAFAQLNGSVWTGTPGTFSSGGVTFEIPGTYQWVCPGGVTSIQAECWGGGGGGSDGRFGCGGGGGEYAAEPTLAVTPGKSYTVVVAAGGSGGPGTFSLKGDAGSPGGTSTFSGDTITVTAHGGKGLSANSGHAAGGTGSQNTTHHNGGQGGQFRSAGQGGSGGGGSGGSSSTGNTGGQASSALGASGGAAVTGGGPGGSGGLGAGTSGQALAGNSPSPGPGGGGGGGGFNQGNQFGERGGNGFAGQVKLTFGTSTVPPANVLRFIMDAPATGGVDGAFMGQIVTTGTVADLHVKYHTGGNLELVGKNLGGTQLFTSGSKAFGANGQPMLVSAELVPSGTGVKWTLTAVIPGATSPVATYTGTQANASIGAVTQVNVNNASGTPDTTATGIGHVAVQFAVDPVTNLAAPLAAWAGELAAARFLRLCAEENMPALLVGNVADTPQMGTQPTDLLVNLLQDCETADLGLMFETRSQFGLGYRTRVSLQNQTPGALLDYNQGHLEVPLVPVQDDQLTHNDIQITRTNGSAANANGSSYTIVLNDGSAMSIAAPPNGVGDYAFTKSTNLFSDSQLPNYGAWLLIIGTVDEYRYPVITMNLARADAGPEFFQIANLDIGDFIAIINPPPMLPPEEIDQLCYGFTETLGVKAWLIAVNAVPESPYASQTGFPAW